MIARKLSLLVACLVATMPSLLAAQSPTSSTSISSADSEARLAKARRLVALTNPSDSLLETNVRGWEAAIARSLAADPVVTSLEAEYPGVSKAGIEAARPLAREACRAFVDRTGAHKAAMLADRMSAAELDTAIAFFDSPTGKKFVRRMIGNLSAGVVSGDLIDRNEETGEARLDVQAAKGMERRAMQTTMSEMTAADHVVMLRFQQQPAATKYMAVAAESDRLAMEEASRPDPEWLRKQGEAIRSAILAYVDARKKS